MQLVPANTALSGLTAEIPSKTWKIDFSQNRIIGQTDGDDAISQAVFFILNTERYRHRIFSFRYGNEFNALIGNDKAFVKSEIKRLTKEALTADDRILDVTNFSFDDQNEEFDQWGISFDVRTANGEMIRIENELKQQIGGETDGI